MGISENKNISAGKNASGPDIRPLSIEYLEPGLRVPLDLYLPGDREDQSVVTVTGVILAGQAPTAAHLQSIRAFGISHVFFRWDQADRMLDYLAGRARQMVDDPTVPNDRKADLLFDTAIGIVEKAMTDPRLGQHIQRGKNHVHSVVRFVTGSRRAVQSLAKTLAIDYTLYTHSVNVCLMCVAFGDYLDLTPDYVVTLGLGALFHDIGLADVPRDILDKPEGIITSDGRHPEFLTVEEWELIRNHPVTGFEALLEQPTLPASALRMVRHHHENLDATGYPDGIDRARIERALQIIRIVDAYDTATSSRPYRPARTPTEGIRYMRREMKGQINTRLLRTFIRFLGYAAWD